MTPIPPLSPELVASLRTDAKDGWNIALALLHLIDRADKRDQDVAEFVDNYSRTIAALCRRLEVLERGFNLHKQDEDAETTESDSVADTAQRITDHAVQAGLTVQDWANAFNAASPVPRQAPPEANNPPAAPTPSPVAPAGGLLESIARIIASDSSEGPESFQGISKDVIDRVAEWLDTREQHGCSALLREEIDR